MLVALLLAVVGVHASSPVCLGGFPFTKCGDVKQMYNATTAQRCLQLKVEEPCRTFEVTNVNTQEGNCFVSDQTYLLRVVDSDSESWLDAEATVARKCNQCVPARLKQDGGARSVANLYQAVDCQLLCRKDKVCLFFTYELATFECTLLDSFEVWEEPEHSANSIDARGRWGQSSSRFVSGPNEKNTDRDFPVTPCYGCMVDFAFAGNDLAGYKPVSMWDADWCKCTCLETEGCAAFTFAEVSSICYLKSNIAGQEIRRGAISGTIYDNCWPKVPYFTVNGTWFPNGPSDLDTCDNPQPLPAENDTYLYCRLKKRVVLEVSDAE